jgi:hypothetical protein
MVAKIIGPETITMAQFIVVGVGFEVDGKKENTKIGVM